MRLTKIGMVFMAVVVALAATGVGYGCYAYGWPFPINPQTTTPYWQDCLTWAVSNDDGGVQSRLPYGTIDPGDNGKDPNQAQTRGVALPPVARYTKDVAKTTAVVDSCESITVTVCNAYPYYYPTIFFGLKNTGTVSAQVVSITVDEDATTPGIDLIPDLTTTVTGISVNQVISAGQEVVGTLAIRVEQIARQKWTYKISVTIKKTSYGTENDGTPGYWKNWSNHYERWKVENWLGQIDDTSLWLGPRTTSGLVSLINAGETAGATMKAKFLRQYIATRLNIPSGRQNLYEPRNITSVSGYGYLGVANPTAASLAEIIDAIEAKYGTSITNSQYEILKNICEGLNNVWY